MELGADNLGSLIGGNILASVYSSDYFIKYTENYFPNERNSPGGENITRTKKFTRSEIIFRAVKFTKR